MHQGFKIFFKISELAKNLYVEHNLEIILVSYSQRCHLEIVEIKIKKGIHNLPIQ